MGFQVEGTALLPMAIQDPGQQLPCHLPPSISGFQGFPGHCHCSPPEGERAGRGTVGGLAGPGLEGVLSISVQVPLLDLNAMAKSNSGGGKLS